MKYLIIVIFLIGCETSEPLQDMQYKAEYERLCTDEQLKQVETYFQNCQKTGYLNSHCFDRAIVMLCDIIPTPTSDTTTEEE